MEKFKFTEQFFIKGKIDDVSQVDTKLIKNHILSNFTLDNRMTNNQYWYLKDYVRVPYHQHIQWVQDFLRDHYRLEHGRTLVLLAKDGIRGIVQQTGESVNTHNNIQDWHLENSPDISCLFCVSDNEKPAEIVFEYDDGRNRHRRWKVPMEKNTFVIFSSSLNHYITKNEDKDFLVNLSLQFQLI